MVCAAGDKPKMPAEKQQAGSFSNSIESYFQ
jgi:hypothetical protein